MDKQSGFPFVFLDDDSLLFVYMYFHFVALTGWLSLQGQTRWLTCSAVAVAYTTSSFNYLFAEQKKTSVLSLLPDPITIYIQIPNIHVRNTHSPPPNHNPFINQNPQPLFPSSPFLPPNRNPSVPLNLHNCPINANFPPPLIRLVNRDLDLLHLFVAYHALELLL